MVHVRGRRGSVLRTTANIKQRRQSRLHKIWAWPAVRIAFTASIEHDCYLLAA